MIEFNQKCCYIYPEKKYSIDTSFDALSVISKPKSVLIIVHNNKLDLIGFIITIINFFDRQILLSVDQWN